MAETENEPPIFDRRESTGILLAQLHAIRCELQANSDETRAIGAKLATHILRMEPMISKYEHVGRFARGIDTTVSWTAKRAGRLTSIAVAVATGYIAVTSGIAKAAAWFKAHAGG